MTAFMRNNIWSLPLKKVTSIFSPAGKHARLSIVIYHRVQEADDELFGVKASAPRFDLQVKYLAENFNVLPLHEAVQRLQSGTLPSRAACITFDDGYADNAEAALPILKKHGASATFLSRRDLLMAALCGMMWSLNGCDECLLIHSI